MTFKQFRVVKMAISAALAVIMAQAVIFGNYFLAAVSVTAAIILMLVLRRRVREVLADERDYELSGRAARWTLSAFSVLATAAAFILFSLRRLNPLLEAVAYVLSYATCALLIFYSLLFGYLRKSPSGRKKLLYIALSALLILFLAMAGLRLFSGDEDVWLCQDGQWVRHGQPSAPMPTEGCGEPKQPAAVSPEQCQAYSAENCPAECVVCPPCEVCSSISCQSADFCAKLGFTREWHEENLQRIAASNKYKVDGQAVSWEEAADLLKICYVRAVMQTHDKKVTLTLVNDIAVKTEEPEIDDIVKLSAAVKDKCGQIILGTE